MHVLIPVIVFITANIWGLFSSIPFTNIDPARSIWNRAIGGVQLASTVYTLDQLPRLLDEQATTHQLIHEYLGGWNATLVSETESAMTLMPGSRPSTAPLTVADDLFLPLPSSNQTPFDLRVTKPEMSAPPFTFDDVSFVQAVVAIILFFVVWLVWSAREDHILLGDLNKRVCFQIRKQADIRQDVGKVLSYQEATWTELGDVHNTLKWLVWFANELRNAPVVNRPVEELMIADSNTTSSDASSAALPQSLQDVLASLDTLCQTIDRSTDVWEGLSERLEVFQSGSQDTQPTETTGATQPTESSGDDPIGASSGGLAQDG